MSNTPSQFSPSSTIIGDDHANDTFPHGHAYIGEKDTYDPYLVQFDDGDPTNPKNWSHMKRWYLTVASGLLVLNATFASSAPAGVASQLIEEFELSPEELTLTIALFVAGYCVGPLVFGPLSEQYGRKPIFIGAFLASTAFQVGAALCQNTISLLVFRFLGGVFASAPLTNSGALISDIWDAKTRGKALAIYTVAPYAGPALGPTVAGYINVAGVSWRWVFWILAIFAGFCCLLVILTVPETYLPILLVKKAQRKRKETGDQRYYALLEKQTYTLRQRIENVLARPFKVLFHEPMLIAITAYMSFIYGVVYLLFQAYPIVFTKAHHFNAGVSGLMYLPIPAGGVLAAIGYLIIFNPGYEEQVKKHAPHPVPPEIRLEMAMYAAPLLVISFFWFAWTSFPSIPFWAPMMAGFLMGFSISWIFFSMFNYIIDCYLSVAASALAANTVMRSLCGAAFPMFGTQMYEGLGPQWASSLLGFIALAMMPIPFVLTKFGPTLRLNSKYAPTKETTISTPKVTDSSSV